MDRPHPSPPSVFWIRAAAIGIIAGSALVVWFMAATSALIDFTIAVAVAVAWCIWLERDTRL